MNAQRSLVEINPFDFVGAVGRPKRADDQLFAGELKKVRKAINAPLNSHPIPGFDVVCQAAEQVSGLRCLIGSEVALGLLCNFEELIVSGLGRARHCINIQEIGIIMQTCFSGESEPGKSWFIPFSTI